MRSSSILNTTTGRDSMFGLLIHGGFSLARKTKKNFHLFRELLAQLEGKESLIQETPILI
jgi:hypothetical protein